MFSRARVFILVAIMSAALGFSGVMDNTAPIALAVACLCAALSALSLLLGLFEAGADTEPDRKIEAPSTSQRRRPAVNR